MSAAATYEKASDQLGAIGAPSGKAARVGLCSMCGKAGASLTCTRCRDPLYCNRDCQVRDGMTPFVHVFGYFTVGTPKTPPFCAPIFVCNYTGLTPAAMVCAHLLCANAQSGHRANRMYFRFFRS